MSLLLNNTTAQLRVELECAKDEIERLRRTIAYMEDHADAPAIIRREARRALEPKL